ncbi:MAG: PhzF family phenazine biosynthesis protein [Gemmobacter sp.]
MMLDYHILDVFTDRPFAGNPLAVVLGADGLDDGQMLTLAREFNLSETVFVQRPADPASTAKLRIFFPTAEIPFAGHPTIGAAVLLAGLRGGLVRVVLEERAGLVPVTFDGEVAELSAPVLPHLHPGRADALRVAAALDLAPGSVGFGAHRPALLAGGPAFLFVPVADLATLGMARPVEPHWSALMAEGGVDSAWLYAPEGDGFRARMFSPGAGIPEDPATGSAAAIFAAQLLAAGALPEGRSRFRIRQGVEMGRPSEIGLAVDTAAGAIRAVRIAGRAVGVAEGRIRIPQREG